MMLGLIGRLVGLWLFGLFAFALVDYCFRCLGCLWGLFDGVVLSGLLLVLVCWVW